MKSAFSALFFALSTVAAHSATLIGQDTATQGNWVGTYGADGYNLFAYNAGAADLASLPGYVTSVVGTSPAPGGNFTWSPGALGVNTGNARFNNAMENPAGPLVNRTAGTFFSGSTATVTINLSAPQSFRLAVYSIDWDLGRGTQSVTVTDMNGASAPDSVGGLNFDNGTWSIFDVMGDAANPVVLTYTGASPNSVTSGLAFDQIPEPSTGVLTLLAGGICLRRRR